MTISGYTSNGEQEETYLHPCPKCKRMIVFHRQPGEWVWHGHCEVCIYDIDMAKWTAEDESTNDSPFPRIVFRDVFPMNNAEYPNMMQAFDDHRDDLILIKTPYVGMGWWRRHILGIDHDER